MRKFFIVELANEHRPRKQRMPGTLRNDAHREAKPFIRAGVTIFDEQIFPLQISADPAFQRLELCASIGLLTLPHQLAFALDGSSTRNLSFGSRP